MVFSSTLFLFAFLPTVLLAYYALPTIFLRNLLLLVSSLFFYAWGEGSFVVVMLGSTFMNYVFGLLVARARSDRGRKGVVAAAVVLNLGLLAYFKYAAFLATLINRGLDATHLPGIGRLPALQAHLPIGISFFTFHALSYVIDIYRRKVAVQKNLIDLALYISLFPQLVAGPIIRYNEVAHSLRRRVVAAADFSGGIDRFILGLGKKVLLANAMGLASDQVFALPASRLSFGLAWLGAIAYLLQIYFDFSGYSDMAIGMGRMFGFHFAENFNYPYISRSITEFWRRWHISLSSWFRDYLYIPLGGNRGSKGRTYFNLITVFFLCGLWHGANWTFILWGLYHGVFLVLERVKLGAALERLPSPARHTYTLLVVLLGWVLFRADSLPMAVYYLKAMAGFGVSMDRDLAVHQFHAIATSDFWGFSFLAVLFSTPVLPLLSGILARSEARAKPLQALASASWISVLGILFFLSAISLAAGTYNPFIYFRF